MIPTASPIAACQRIPAVWPGDDMNRTATLDCRVVEQEKRRVVEENPRAQTLFNSLKGFALTLPRVFSNFVVFSEVNARS